MNPLLKVRHICYIQLLVLCSKNHWGTLLCQDIRRMIANYDAPPYDFAESYWMTINFLSDFDYMKLTFNQIPLMYVNRIMFAIMSFFSGECTFDIPSSTVLHIRAQENKGILTWMRLFESVVEQLIPHARNLNRV